MWFEAAEWFSMEIVALYKTIYTINDVKKGWRTKCDKKIDSKREREREGEREREKSANANPRWTKMMSVPHAGTSLTAIHES